MVRESTSKPGCYALSLRVPREFQPSGIAHYLIMRTNKGYKIKVSLPFYLSVFYRVLSIKVVANGGRESQSKSPVGEWEYPRCCQRTIKEKTKIRKLLNVSL